MSDSDELDRLDAKHERNREQRVERVRQWARYIKSTPVDEWGPQQVKLVNSQVEAARESDLPAEHYEKIEEAGEAFRRDRADDE